MISLEKVTRLQNTVTPKPSTGAVSYAVTQLRIAPIHVCAYMGACVCLCACIRMWCVTA